MKKTTSKILLKTSLILIIIISIIWGIIILFFNTFDMIPKATSTQSILYQNYESNDNKAVWINFKYNSKGAFIAGEKNPIDIEVDIRPFGGNPDLFNKIKNREINITLIFNGAKLYPMIINNLTGAPEDVVIDKFDYNSEKNILYKKIKLYYSQQGKYSPTILLGKVNNEYSVLSSIILNVSPQETNLQLLSNSRILALTLILIGLTLFGNLNSILDLFFPLNK